MQAIQSRERTWRVPTMQIEGQLGLVVILWAAALILGFGLVFVVSLFRDIRISGWEIVAGLAAWYLAFMNGWLMFVQVPMFVANGRTRRDSFIESSITGVVLSMGTALLVTVGFLVERLIYGIAGWNLTLDEDHLFTSHTDVVPMFIEYALIYLVWGMVGIFVGIALYRSADFGWLALVPGVVIIALSGTLERGEIGLFGFATRLISGFEPTSMAWAIPLALGGAVIAWLCAWLVVRDMPLRAK